MTFGEKLQKLRSREGLSQDALAEILAGKEPDEIGSAGLRRYEFDGFAVITR